MECFAWLYRFAAECAWRGKIADAARVATYIEEHPNIDALTFEDCLLGLGHTPKQTRQAVRLVDGLATGKLVRFIEDRFEVQSQTYREKMPTLAAARQWLRALPKSSRYFICHTRARSVRRRSC